MARNSLSSGPGKADPGRHSLLIGLVRTITTAEVVERGKYGSYGSWRTLLEHQQEYLNSWLGRFYSPNDVNVHFGDTPEILPGWNLRLNVHADGEGYDLLLEDVTDKNGYAALSDETWSNRRMQMAPVNRDLPARHLPSLLLKHCNDARGIRPVENGKNGRPFLSASSSGNSLEGLVATSHIWAA